MQPKTASLRSDRPDVLTGPALPADTTLTRLTAYVDERGMVAEIFRTSWPTGIAPLQWSTCISRAGILRGMHAHVQHDDYLCVVQGRLCIGLCDLRAGSPTERQSVFFEMTGESLSSLFIPHGVAHAFYAYEPTTYVLGTSHYYDPDDELGCFWTDDGLGIAWPFQSPELSARDAKLGTLEELLPRIRPWRHA